MNSAGGGATGRIAGEILLWNLNDAPFLTPLAPSEIQLLLIKDMVPTRL